MNYIFQCKLLSLITHHQPAQPHLTIWQVWTSACKHFWNWAVGFQSDRWWSDWTQNHVQLLEPLQHWSECNLQGLDHIRYYILTADIFQVIFWSPSWTCTFFWLHQNEFWSFMPTRVNPLKFDGVYYVNNVIRCETYTV